MSKQRERRVVATDRFVPHSVVAANNATELPSQGRDTFQTGGGYYGYRPTYDQMPGDMLLPGNVRDLPMPDRTPDLTAGLITRGGPSVSLNDARYAGSPRRDRPSVEVSPTRGTRATGSAGIDRTPSGASAAAAANIQPGGRYEFYGTRGGHGYQINDSGHVERILRAQPANDRTADNIGRVAGMATNAVLPGSGIITGPLARWGTRAYRDWQARRGTPDTLTSEQVGGASRGGSSPADSAARTAETDTFIRNQQSGANLGRGMGGTYLDRTVSAQPRGARSDAGLTGLTTRTDAGARMTQPDQIGYFNEAAGEFHNGTSQSELMAANTAEAQRTAIPSAQMWAEAQERAGDSWGVGWSGRSGGAAGQGGEAPFVFDPSTIGANRRIDGPPRFGVMPPTTPLPSQVNTVAERPTNAGAGSALAAQSSGRMAAGISRDPARQAYLDELIARRHGR